MVKIICLAKRVSLIMIIAIFSSLPAYSKETSIIVLGEHTRYKAPEGELARRLIRVKLDDQKLTTATLEPLTSKNVMAATFFARDNALLFLYCPRINNSGNNNRTTFTIAMANISDGKIEKRLERLYKLRYSPGIETISDFSISYNKNMIAFTLYKYVSYMGFNRLSSAIYVYDIKNDALEQVVPYGYLCEKPVFSPDDTKIAFYRAPLDIWSENGESSDNNGHILCMVNTNGTALKELSPPSNTIFPNLFWPPAWAPDGQSILFIAKYNIKGTPSNRMSLPGIYHIKIEQPGLERLTSNDMGATYPSWAPDSKRFCYVRRGVLMVMSLDTRETKAINTGTIVESCAWAPSSELIAYTSSQSNSGTETYLSVVTPDGKINLKKLVSIDSVFGNLCWAN